MIWVVHPGSGPDFTHPGSRIKGSKRHRTRIRNTEETSSKFICVPLSLPISLLAELLNPPYLAGMSPYISLKIKKRHYEYHMIETHIQLSTTHELAVIFLI